MVCLQPERKMAFFLLAGDHSAGIPENGEERLHRAFLHLAGCVHLIISSCEGKKYREETCRRSCAANIQMCVWIWNLPSRSDDAHLFFLLPDLQLKTQFFQAGKNRSGIVAEQDAFQQTGSFR